MGGVMPPGAGKMGQVGVLSGYIGQTGSGKMGMCGGGAPPRRGGGLALIGGGGLDWNHMGELPRKGGGGEGGRSRKGTLGQLGTKGGNGGGGGGGGDGIGHWRLRVLNWSNRLMMNSLVMTTTDPQGMPVYRTMVEMDALFQTVTILAASSRV